MKKELEHELPSTYWVIQIKQNKQQSKTVLFFPDCKYGIIFGHKKDLATMWINLQNLLSERSQAQKVTYRMIQFIFNLNPE